MRNRIVIPTFFLTHEDKVVERDGIVNHKVIRKYDDNVMGQLMATTSKNIVLGKGSIFNAYLPNLEKVTDSIKHKNSNSFCCMNELDAEAEFILYLPEIENNNRMLHMELVSMGKSVEISEVRVLSEMNISNNREQEDEEKIVEYLKEHKDEVFAKVVFWAKNDTRYKKGSEDPYNNYGKFLCLKENYCDSWKRDCPKYILVTDEEIKIHYVFECWIEELPIPGQSDVPYVYAYVDGSASGNQYGSGAIVCVDDVFISHDCGVANEANYTGECVAATNVLNFLSEMDEDCFKNKEVKEVYIYFDNIQLGYVPVEMYKHDKDAANDMWNMIEKFESKYPNVKIVFEHVDAHTAIYGNEFADRIATVKPVKKEGAGPYQKRIETMSTRDKIWVGTDNSFKVFKKK